MGWRWVGSHLCAVVAGAALVVLLAPRLPAPGPSHPTLDPLRAAPGAFRWSEPPPPMFPIPPYAAHLAGAAIVLDPGHAGQVDKGGDWKRGPTGLREAEVNLRVAHFLREFLLAAGADVTMTREDDVERGLSDPEDLSQRIALANELRADLFLSIHHNGGPPEANYTTVFYHGRPDHSPASLAAGRHLVTGLNDALRLEQHVGCALVSDYTIYRGEGFRVLREALVPAVLSEASFHSNALEEERLRDPLYNRREAYGLFLGLARWAQAGLPRVRLVERSGGARGAGDRLLIALDDGLARRGGLGAGERKILPDSLVVRLDGNPLRYEVDWGKNQLKAVLPKEANRKPARLYVDFTTVFGQHVLHPWIELRPK